MAKQIGSPVRAAAIARARLGRRFKLSGKNARSTYILIGGRIARDARSVKIGWTTPFFLIVVMLAILSFAILDQAVGGYRGQWDGAVMRVASVSTDVALGVWYIVPAVALLLAMNLINWKRLSPRGLLLAYNWTMVASYVLVTVGGALLLSNVVKRIIGRARPRHYEEHGAFAFQPFAVDASWASFPSGHSATIGAVAGACIMLWPGTRCIVLPAAILLAATRVVVGAHYPSDVVVGFAFGLVFAVGAGALFARLGYLFQCHCGELPVRKTSTRLVSRTFTDALPKALRARIGQFSG